MIISILILLFVGAVNCVKFNEESTVVLSGSVDGTVRAWDCRSNKQDPIQVGRR